MADHIAVTPSVAANKRDVATDDVDGAHYQRVKLDLGGDGATSPVVGALPVRDQFGAGEVLADQDGAGGVLTFTFSAPMHFAEIHCVGGEGRADPYGGTPTATRGIRCGDDIPRAMPVPGVTAIEVYAETGTTVTVHGQRYA